MSRISENEALRFESELIKDTDFRVGNVDISRTCGMLMSDIQVDASLDKKIRSVKKS